MTKRELQERDWMIRALTTSGIDYADIDPLRRISRTLRRWHELECGTGDDRVSLSVERDEVTNKPFLRRQYATASGWKDNRYPIADRETGALKRLAKFQAKYPTLTFYVQGDPRGCALYSVSNDQVPAGADINAYYSRGIAIL